MMKETEIIVKISRKLEVIEMMKIAEAIIKSFNIDERKGLDISFRFISKEIYGEKW